MYIRPMKSERTLVHNNFSYPRSNHYSYCLYLTYYYILYTHELHFLVKINTAVLYTLFSFVLFLPDDGPERAETCTRCVVVVVVVVIIIIIIICEN